MDKKLKADIAESVATTELLKRGFKVLRPVGDRLPYDLAVDVDGRLIRIQVKSAWFDRKKQMYSVDVRRTKTNRRRMIRDRYRSDDFDFALLYIDERHVFYVMPIAVFTKYGSTISIVETEKRQRRPESSEYRERWDLLSPGATRLETIEEAHPSNSVKPSPYGLSPPDGNTEPSPEEECREGVETRRRAPHRESERAKV